MSKAASSWMKKSGRKYFIHWLSPHPWYILSGPSNCHLLALHFALELKLLKPKLRPRGWKNQAGNISSVKESLLIHDAYQAERERESRSYCYLDICLVLCQITIAQVRRRGWKKSLGNHVSVVKSFIHDTSRETPKRKSILATFHPNLIHNTNWREKRETHWMKNQSLEIFSSVTKSVSHPSENRMREPGSMEIPDPGKSFHPWHSWEKNKKGGAFHGIKVL